MIERISALGLSQTSRIQSQSTERPTPGQKEAKEVTAPVLASEQAANRVVKKTVEAIEHRESGPERRTPGDDESDRTKQVDLEVKSYPGVGLNVDVMA